MFNVDRRRVTYCWDHALGVKERAVDGDGVEHDFQKFGAVVVVERQNDVFEFVIERFGFAGVIG